MRSIGGMGGRCSVFKYSIAAPLSSGVRPFQVNYEKINSTVRNGRTSLCTGITNFVLTVAKNVIYWVTSRTLDRTKINVTSQMRFFQNIKSLIKIRWHITEITIFMSSYKTQKLKTVFTELFHKSNSGVRCFRRWGSFFLGGGMRRQIESNRSSQSK